MLCAVVLAACQAPEPMPPAPPPGTVLSVALQEGFESDRVIVRLDGVEVARRDDVTTDLRIGLATSFEVSLDDDSRAIEVRVPSQGVVGQTVVSVDGPLHLGVSVVEGEVRFRASEQPFGYL